MAGRSKTFTSAMRWPATALVVAQVLHALTPAETEGDSPVGLYVGLLFLGLSIAAAFGAFTGRTWSVKVGACTGVAVALGFIAYHAAPVHSPLTKPYLGEDVGAKGWFGVAIAIAAGAWAAWAGRGELGRLSRPGASAPPSTGRAA